MSHLIRTYRPADRARLTELFAAAGEGSPSGELWGDPASERAIYLDPYIEHEPESLLLAEVAGELVGYLTGCLDSARLPSENERFTHAVGEFGLLRKPRAVRFFLRSAADTAGAKIRGRPTATGDFDDPRWPSHLHINVIPHARGTGVADGLMTRWLEMVDAAGSPGCHLQTLVENDRAIAFFRRFGFVQFGPTPLVPGIRHRGRRLHQLTMVRPASRSRIG